MPPKKRGLLERLFKRCNRVTPTPFSVKAHLQKHKKWWTKPLSGTTFDLVFGLTRRFIHSHSRWFTPSLFYWHVWHVFRSCSFLFLAPPVVAVGHRVRLSTWKLLIPKACLLLTPS